MCMCGIDPDLVYDKCLEREDGFENALDFFPTGYRPTSVQPEMSGGFLGFSQVWGFLWWVIFLFIG